MKRRYHTLLVDTGNGWEIHFGDYDLDCVKDEQDDYCSDGFPRKCTKIITTGDSQQDILGAVARLNA